MIPQANVKNIVNVMDKDWRNIPNSCSFWKEWNHTNIISYVCSVPNLNGGI